MIKLTWFDSVCEIEDNVCVAKGDTLEIPETFAEDWTYMWQRQRNSGRVTLQDDQDLLFANYITEKSPGMAMDTSKHVPISSDQTRGLVY